MCYEDPPYDGCKEADCPKLDRGKYAPRNTTLTRKRTMVDMWRDWYEKAR